VKLRVELTRLAQLDLDELIVYIGKDNPAAAVAISSRILARIDLLQEQPGIGRKGRRRGTRELVVEGTRYIVAYRIDAAGAEVQILRIVHSSRRWPERI
jgi:toxin ParE1/3/4